MNAKRWYLRKRVLLPLMIAALFGLALWLAVSGSNVSRIIVYNESGDPLPAIRIRACGQTKVISGLPAEASVCWLLKDAGVASPIELEFASEPPRIWQGQLVAPRGGHRVTLRIWPDGQVEAHTQISFWQRWIAGSPDIND